MSKKIIGRIAPVMCGEWNQSKKYEVYDVVYRYGSTYIAIIGSDSDAYEANLNIDPATDDGTYWVLVAQRGGDGIDFINTDKLYKDY